MKARRPPPPMPALAKQPSTRPKASSVAFIASLTEAGSATSQMRVSTLPGPVDMVAAAALFFSALRPQIETLQPVDVSACAMPSPIPPLPPVMTACGRRGRKCSCRFPLGRSLLVFTREVLDVRPVQGQMFWPTMDKPARKIKYGSRHLRSGLPRHRKRAGHNSRGNNAVQARHARFRWIGRGSQARPPGGHERGLDGHAGRPR